MSPALAAEIAQLERMTATQLGQRYETLLGEQCRSRNKRYLVRRIAWRLQAQAEGGLSERARKRAEELAEDAEIRVTPPRQKSSVAVAPVPLRIDSDRDPRLPPPGSWIERKYKGQSLRVLVVTDGFEFEGQRYRSLSAIAKAVSGSHVNGFQFFRLRRAKGWRREAGDRRQELGGWRSVMICNCVTNGSARSAPWRSRQLWPARLRPLMHWRIQAVQRASTGTRPRGSNRTPYRGTECNPPACDAPPLQRCWMRSKRLLAATATLGRIVPHAESGWSIDRSQPQAHRLARRPATFGDLASHTFSSGNHSGGNDEV